MVETNKARLHARVEGRVQGVSFRMFVLDTALKLELTGWVRNCWNGQVEVCAEGDRQSLDQLLAALRRGPRSAFVSDLKFDWQNFKDEFERFDIRSTA
jgi:acylphosphatase